MQTFSDAPFSGTHLLTPTGRPLSFLIYLSGLAYQQCPIAATENLLADHCICLSIFKVLLNLLVTFKSFESGVSDKPHGLLMVELLQLLLKPF